MSTTLAVYNLPNSMNEEEIGSVFPLATSVNLVRQQSSRSRSPGMCILHFESSRDCQLAYHDCKHGKEIDGNTLRVEYYNDREDRSDAGSRNYCESDFQPRRYRSDNPSRSTNNSDSGCTLTISNIPYAATEDDLMNEFPEAVSLTMAYDDQRRFKGVAHILFPDSYLCGEALSACNDKLMDGRQLRGRIQREQDRNQGYYGSRMRRDDGPRDYGNRNRDYGHRNRDYGNQRDYNQNGSRNYGNRQGWQSNQIRRPDNRFQNNRNGSGDYSQSDSNYRRERSPIREEPVRGYGKDKGPRRITSAVIHNQEENEDSKSSTSSF